MKRALLVSSALSFAQVFATDVGKNADADMKCQAALTALNPISFEEREALSKQAHQLMDRLETAKQTKSKAQGELDELSASFTDLVKGMGVSQAGVESFKDENSFLNRLNRDSAKTYGTLSALVYDVDANKSLGKANVASTKLDRDISALMQSVSDLEAFAKAIPTTKESAFKKFVKNLSIYDITLPEKATVQDVRSAIAVKLTNLDDQIKSLEGQRTRASQEDLNKAREAFAGNLQGMNYDVRGVFHRNNGEFSGAAAYNEDNKELVLSFAGSKSTMDWVKNIFGWNAKMSYSHGLLSNISFHSGFASHLDDNAASFFAFMRYFLQDFKDKNGEGATLKIVGTGHSLGGAIAEIFAAAAKQMAEKMGIKVDLGVMTFGAPNVHNANTVKNFHAITGGAGNIINFTQAYDPVSSIVFWRGKSGATVSGDTSLIRDTNGTLALPLRANPHSIADYYHAVDAHFAALEEKMTPVRAVLSRMRALEREIEASKMSVAQLSDEGSKIVTCLARHDQDSAAAFADESEAYLAAQNKALEATQDTMRQVKVVLTAAVEQNQPLMIQTQLEERLKVLEAQVSIQEAYMKALLAQTTWRDYAAKLRERAQSRVAQFGEGSILLDAQQVVFTPEMLAALGL